MSISKNLKKRMDQKGWTLARLSKETGVNKSTLHAWTVGRGTINLDYLKKVASALEISVHQLAYGEPDPHEAIGQTVLKEIFSGDVRVTLHRIERKGS